MSVTRRTMELATAAFIVAFGGLIIGGSLQLSTGWGPTGPESGYFPFRLGMLLTLVGGALLAQTALSKKPGTGDEEIFTTLQQFRQCLALFVPTLVLVMLMPWLGCYLAAGIYLCYMTRVLGAFTWIRAVALAISLVLAFYVLFEFWFQVPLAKGPIEKLLGIY